MQFRLKEETAGPIEFTQEELLGALNADQLDELDVRPNPVQVKLTIVFIGLIWCLHLLIYRRTKTTRTLGYSTATDSSA